MNTTASHIHGVALAGMLALIVLPSRADTRDGGAGRASNSSPFWGVACAYPMGVTESPQDWITKATDLGLANRTATAPTLWNTRQASQAGGENLDQRKDAPHFLPGGDKRNQAADHTIDGVTAKWQKNPVGAVNEPVSDAGVRGSAVWSGTVDGADPSGSLDHSLGVSSDSLGFRAGGIDAIPAIITACAIALFGVAMCGTSTTRRRKR